ncbi:hypothetical protein PoB_006283500 [Plakobranchus ocellatus]|uniref:Uncharacterized protein n=1 Tax=Plakobranchus ocellatus TaxID=259542 RepID=A0AAV4CWV0_9GAST|nr:hypothetical protein PoB_006283500 [Plakobranchus ocellatus]
MASYTDLDRLLQELATAATSTNISNGAVVFHLINTNTSKFKKKDFKPTVDVLVSLIGGDDQDKIKLRVKCKDVYNRFTGLKKHFTNPGTWQKLHEFLHDIFYQTQPNNSIQPDHSYSCQPTTSTPKQHKRKSSPVHHTFSPKKLKTDCEKCPTQREAFLSTVNELKAARSLNYQMKRNVADLKRAYRKKAIDQRNRRHTDKIKCLKQTVSSLSRRAEFAEAANLRNSKQFHKSKQRTVRLEKKCRNLQNELQISREENACLNGELADLKKKCSSLERQVEQLSEMNEHSNSENEITTIGSTAGNIYNAEVRDCMYFMLSHQVPVSACAPIFSHVIKTITGKCPNRIPCTTTVAQMAQELGVISSLHVASEILKANSKICLSWDATSVDGSHINEIHITNCDKSHLTVDVRKIPGGTAADYTEHINSAIANLAYVYSKFNKADEAEILSTIKNKISCTVTDRAPVNSRVVRNLQEGINSDIIELHCNVHPLDAFAKKCKSALIRFDTEKKYCCFGKEGRVANLILAVSKMRHKAGSGDPEGFKDFLRTHDLPLSTFPRYVGNRLHILLHSAGILFLHKEKMLTFLSEKSTAGQLRQAILHDLKLPSLLDQLWALAVIGKAVSGPWMSKFYTSKGSNLEMVPVLQSSRTQLQNWGKNITHLTRLDFDVFGQPIQDDPVSECLRQPVVTDVRKNMLMELIQAILSVYESQLKRYTDGVLVNISPEQIQSTVCAPVHNMQSERALGLLDGMWRRARNATAGFLNGKIQFRLNKTQDWLNQHNCREKEKLVAFVVKTASLLRKESAAAEKLICTEISRRRQAVSQKRDASKRYSFSKEIKKAIKGEASEVVLDEECRNLLEKFKHDPHVLTGMLFLQVWFEDEQDIPYYGRIRSYKMTDNKAKKEQKHLLTVSYWKREGVESEAVDYDINVEDFFTDMAINA